MVLYYIPHSEIDIWMKVGRMRNFLQLGISALLFFFFSGSAAYAAECGAPYRVKPDDTLSGIASQAYGEARKWTVIYNGNLDTIGTNPHLIRIGQEFRIPCLREDDAVEIALPKASGKAVKLLTAGGYQPFTDKDLRNGGLITDIVNTVMLHSPDIESYGYAWIEDWSAHLDPLLSEHTYDLGFPWLKPDCAGSPDSLRCSQFVFSEPMFEMLVVLFVDNSRSFSFTEDDDIVGRTLCRPSGYYTHDLEKGGRRWITDDKITLKQPSSVKDCFDLLLNGDVDAVALNEFTGRSAVSRLAIDDRVSILEGKPLSIEGLHLLVHKSHPEAEPLVAAVNAGLERIKQKGAYQNIVDQHLAAFWSQLE